MLNSGYKKKAKNIFLKCSWDFLYMLAKCLRLFANERLYFTTLVQFL